MVKRKRGWKSKYNFDEIDFIIMSSLLRKFPEGYGVLELCGLLDLEHKNLKRHVDKLERSQLIKKEPVPKSSKIIIKLGDVYTKDVVENILKIIGDMKRK